MKTALGLAGVVLGLLVLLQPALASDELGAARALKAAAGAKKATTKHSVKHKTTKKRKAAKKTKKAAKTERTAKKTTKKRKAHKKTAEKTTRRKTKAKKTTKHPVKKTTKKKATTKKTTSKKTAIKKTTKKQAKTTTVPQNRLMAPPPPPGTAHFRLGPPAAPPAYLPAPLNLFLPPCTAVWEVQPGDTCAEIASASGINVTQLLALNLVPPLSCSNPPLGRLVCTSGSGNVICGTQLTTPGLLETCASFALTAALGVFEGLNQTFVSPGLLSQLNPSVCSSLLGLNLLQPLQPVCLPQNPGFQDLTADDGDSRRRLRQSLPDSSFAPRRRLQQAAVQCIGNAYTVKASDNTSSCAAVAAAAGISSTDQLFYLNPSLANSNCTNVTTGYQVCQGCVGTICGVGLSSSMSRFLNYPALQQQLCAILVKCQFQNTPVLNGTAGANTEAMTMLLNAPNSAATAANGFPAIGSFFASPNGTYYTTGPNPALEILIHPNAASPDVNGTYQGVVEFTALTQTVSPPTPPAPPAPRPPAPASASGRRLVTAVEAEIAFAFSLAGSDLRNGEAGRKLLGTITTRQSQNPQAKLVARWL